MSDRISSHDTPETIVSNCGLDPGAESVRASFDAFPAKGRPIRYQHRLVPAGRRRISATIAPSVPEPEGSGTVGPGGKHLTLEDEVTNRGVGAAATLDLRLLSLQEEVYQRIASDLHDSTCQHLIAASLNVMRMRRTMNDVGRAESICDDIDASIAQALREIRALTYLLHPQHLMVDGLKATIEQFIDGFSARTSLKAVLEIAPEVDRLPYEKQRTVLRVIQEALMNIFRHAKATQVEIAMEAAPAHFKLRISDDGHGMPIGKARLGSRAISPGVGIPAMRARLQRLGGVLQIRSSTAAECHGTTLSAVIPHSLPRKRMRAPERRHRHLGHHKTKAPKAGSPATILDELEIPAKF